MEAVVCHSPKSKREFLSFAYSLHKNSPYFVDVQLFVLRDILNGILLKDCRFEAVTVQSGGVTACQCLLILHPQMSDVLQLGFFDALPNAKNEVDFLLEYAASKAKSLCASRVTIGINGHLSCGVGILQNCFEQKISFDSLYNPPYYAEYFDKLPSYGLTTYKLSLSDGARRLKSFAAKAGGFEIRYLDKSKLKDELELFGRLCNATLCDTSFYCTEKPEHFYNLMRGMSYFLEPENIIFLMKSGREVGFLYWHPDFNAPLKARNSTFGLLLRIKFGIKAIRSFKINALGILPEFRNSGAAAHLLSELLHLIDGRFDCGETTFVWDDNVPSTALSLGFSSMPHRRYKVYVLQTEE